jgi:WD40 repeat protein/anti-sigma factor RsiW
MLQSTACPDSGRLKDLLDGTLPEAEQAELNAHLEACPRCQQALEGLVAGQESWAGAACRLGENDPEPEAGLRRVMREMKSDAPAAETPTEAPADDLTLDFLSPPEKPEHLGRLRHYDVLEVIGRGGMGVVLKAFDTALQRVVAIKVVAPQLATSAAARKRFEREARAAAAVSHEHVVAIHAVDETGGLPYLVMEYVSGVSLQDRLDRTGPLELKEILRIGMQTARGLAAAHAQGLVHRDIKPANILLHNGVERVKITDFGLARAVDDASLTQSGVVAGTPQYMAPEQARGETVDHRADLFSLGSVLYALCTGRPPFRASTTMAVLKRVSEEKPRPLAEINPDIPAWLSAIIDKLHAKDPVERYQSAAEVAELLGAHLARLQQPQPDPAARPSEALPPAPPVSRVRARRWAVAAMLLVLCGGGLVVTEATGLTRVTELAATVLRIPTADGTLVVEVDDPDVQVTVDGEEVVLRGAGPQEIRLRPGRHRVQATKDGKPVPVDKEIITISRGGKQIVRVSREETEPRQPGDSPLGPIAPRVGEGPSRAVGKVGEIATLTGHKGEVNAVAFSPDGKQLVSAGGNPKDQPGEIRLWDRATNKTRMFANEPLALLSAAFSPGSTTLATGCADGRVYLWDDTGRLLTVLRGKSRVNSVAIAPDGQTLAAGSADSTVKIWHLGTRELLDTIACRALDGVLRVAYSPDGKTLAVGGFRNGSGEVWLYEVGSWIVRAQLHNTATAMAFSPDGTLLVTGSGLQKGIKFWRVADGKELSPPPAVLAPSNVVFDLAFSPDGRLLATAGQDMTVRLWDVGAWKIRSGNDPKVGETIVPGKELVALRGHTDWVNALAFSPDGKTLASASRDRTVKLWDVSGAYPVVGEDDKKQPAAGHSRSRALLQERLDTLRSIAKQKQIMYEAASIPLQDVMQAKLPVLKAELELCESAKERVAIHEQIVTLYKELEKITGSIVETGRAAPSELLDVKAKRLEAEKELENSRRELQAPTGPTKKAGAEGEGPGRAVGKVHEITTLTAHSSAVRTVAFSPDGEQLVSAGGDPEDHPGEIRLWNKTDYTQRNFLNAPLATLSAAFSPGSTTLATGCADGRVYLWDDTGTLLTVLRAKGRVNSVAFAPDGQTLAVGCADKTVRIWHLGTRELLETLGYATLDSVSCVAYCPDGKTLAVVGGVGPGSALMLVEVGSWKTRATLTGAGMAAAFSPDGALLATGSDAGGPLVKLWRVADGKELTPRHALQPSGVFALAFSPNGRLLATAGQDMIVRLWDVRIIRTGAGPELWRNFVAGEELVTLRGHTGWVNAIAFSPDGKTLASASRDRSVKLWDVSAAYRLAKENDKK